MGLELIEKKRSNIELKEIGKEVRGVSRDTEMVIMEIQRIQERGKLVFGGGR